MRIAIAAALALTLAACNQQAVTDLAKWQGDLGGANTALTAAKAAQAAAEQKATALEGQLKQAGEQLAAFQKAADDAAAAAAQKVGAVQKKAAAKAAVVKKAAATADKIVAPVTPSATPEQKAKAKR